MNLKKNGQMEPTGDRDRERELIRVMLGILSPAATPGQPWFSTDAEPFQIDGKALLFTTDEFSAEDLFRDDDPAVLGWNLAAATLSDIYAAGGIPRWFGHSISLPARWDDRYAGALCKGIAACLEKTGAFFIGGDLGFSETWHYTGVAIGETLQPMNRMGACPGDLIYMTGRIGKGNLEAALSLYSKNPALKPLLDRYRVKFPVRNEEAGLVRQYAHCCIDTSDGVLKALQTLAELNGVGFVADQLPVIPEGLLATRLLGKPPELLFLGESGEYELLFTIPPEKENDLLREAGERELLFSLIGRITETGQMLLARGGLECDLSRFDFSARDFTDTGAYLDKLIKTLKHGDEA